MAKKKRKIKAASGKAQPRQIPHKLANSGKNVWARPSGKQRSKDVTKVTEAVRTQGGFVTVRTKDGPKPSKASISRKPRGGRKR